MFQLLGEASKDFQFNIQRWPALQLQLHKKKFKLFQVRPDELHCIWRSCMVWYWSLTSIAETKQIALTKTSNWCFWQHCDEITKTKKNKNKKKIADYETKQTSMYTYMEKTKIPQQTDTVDLIYENSQRKLDKILKTRTLLKKWWATFLACSLPIMIITFNWIRLLKFINWLEIGDKCKYTLSIDSQWITC